MNVFLIMAISVSLFLSLSLSKASNQSSLSLLQRPVINSNQSVIQNENTVYQLRFCMNPALTSRLNTSKDSILCYEILLEQLLHFLHKLVPSAFGLQREMC